MQFGARLLSGAICGAAIGSPHHPMLGGLLAGIMARSLATLGGHDPPAAFLEDAIAIGGALWIGVALALAISGTCRAGD